MEKLDINTLKKDLEDQLVLLLQQTKVSELNSLEADAVNPDRSDLATRYRQHERERVLTSQTEKQVAEIEEAIKRIEAGTYGTCTKCGNAIAAGRLEALPHAALCIQCQAALENNH
jgi:DnaK suppressor protein